MPAYYTYLISSLPMLNFSAKAPFSLEGFLIKCKNLVPEKELEEILIRLSGLNEKACVIGDVAKCEVGKENVEFC